MGVGAIPYPQSFRRLYLVMAIIYCAENLLTGKKYIGSTIQSLDRRRSQHLTKAHSSITGNYKFPNALRKYPQSNWQWSILAEVETVNLATVEKQFILELDTINHGYNSILGSSKPKNQCYDQKEVFNLFHPVFGFVSATRDELRELDGGRVLKYLTCLMSGIKPSYYGWRKQSPLE